MDLSGQWSYIEEIAEERLRNNVTCRHVSKYGPELEILGVAGELAARMFLGLPEDLHVNFDGGTDFLLGDGWSVDVKATKLNELLDHRFLQWPVGKPVRADLIFLTAVDVEHKTATVVGFAYQREILHAPVNASRAIPCREIDVNRLHPCWGLEILRRRTSGRLPFTNAPFSTRAQAAARA